MSDLTNTERLNLDKMIKASDAEDNTEKIRELKHKYPNDADLGAKVRELVNKTPENI